nr:uncharacterized protein LOC119184053 [Rhipicephalus microplus]
MELSNNEPMDPLPKNTQTRQAALRLSLIFMLTFVFFEVVFLPERLWAQRARIRSLARMTAHVTVQYRLLLEALGAQVALVRSLAGADVQHAHVVDVKGSTGCPPQWKAQAQPPQLAGFCE